jgi:hypothetical protein
MNSYAQIAQIASNCSNCETLHDPGRFYRPNPHSPHSSSFSRLILIPVHINSENLIRWTLSNLIKPIDKIVLLHVRTIIQSTVWNPENERETGQLLLNRLASPIVEARVSVSLSFAIGDKRHIIIEKVRPLSLNTLIYRSRSLKLISS